MGLSTTYTKAETDYLIQQLEIKTSSGYQGDLLKTDAAPTTKGFYALLETGIYPNLGNINAEAGKLNFASFDGTTWSLIAVDMPQASQNIRLWDDLQSVDFPLTEGNQVIYQNNTWIVSIGEIVHSTDIPGVSAKWEVIGNDLKLDVEGGALSYSVALKLLGGYLIGDDNTETQRDIINLVEFGGKFLHSNDVVRTDSRYPDGGVIYKLDVSKAVRLEAEGLTDVGGDPNNRPLILGYKNDGSYVVLQRKDVLNLSSFKTYDLSDFKTISIQVDTSGLPTRLKLFEKGPVTQDVKQWSEDRLKVIDFFLNPYETVYQDLAMPQPNEKDDAIINTFWQQYTAAGTANGVIAVADLPDDFDTLEIEGNFSVGGSGTLWLGGYNKATGVYDKLLVGVAGTGTKKFTINRNKYEGYVYSRYDNNQTYKLSKSKNLSIKTNSVKDYIDNHVSSGSAISNETRAQIARPTKLLRIEFTTTDTLPTAKGVLASGEILITDMQGLGIKKYATLEVQGSSSASFPKKNWTIALFNDEAKTSGFKLRIGEWVEHSEFVFKSNWIDATHARNLISNHIWEDIVQSREGYPKRENEIAYVESYTGQTWRFDSGALTHVDGFPAEVYINGGFYGIGTFNLGKKRENYDLISSNQNHIQLAAATHANFYSYKAAEWEIRNPKTPDANFLTKINAWFAANALSGQAFKDAFPTNHDVKNAVDFFLLAEFIQSPDMYTKNLMVTSWDGVKFYFLPYDMDTTFGLQWDGLTFTGWETSIRSAGFWNKFYSAYTAEIKARYAELKAKGIFSLDNVYKHADRINKTFGLELYKKEQAQWTDIPSNSIIYAGFPQIYEWTKNRLIWLDSQYN